MSGSRVTATASNKALILFLGADWWGSDARALAVASRQLGNAVIEVNYEDFIPSQWLSFPLRVFRKLARPLLVREYNRAILRHVGNDGVDFLLVFKGKHLAPRTLDHFLKARVPVYCFYPDVSFLDHGTEIWHCLPKYACVFTTKSFHLQDSGLRSRIRELRLVAHGFDPEVHRPLHRVRTAKAYDCDVSFVGCWSPKKERMLNALVESCAGIDLRVWGPGWGRAAEAVRARWQGRGAYGDELSVIYSSSKINLALLSEAGGGTQVGDQVTVRTWQIPAVGGFMLHELTTELQQYFQPEAETGVFRSLQELPTKVRWYLENGAARRQVASAGHRRALAQNYTYVSAAEAILAYHEEKRSSPANPCVP